MSERVIWKGTPVEVHYVADDEARLLYGSITGAHWYRVPHGEAHKARDAMSAKPPREVEVVERDNSWSTRTVRLVPVVVVKARGKVVHVSRGIDTSRVMVRQYVTLYDANCVHGVEKIAALAMHDDVEVEIISIDGGPDTVRRMS